MSKNCKRREMKLLKLLVVVILQLASYCELICAKTESLATPTAVPFQLITSAEFKAISELSNGNPFITQNRLLNSGSQVITEIINNIVNGLISPVNITGLDPIYNSILSPTNDKPQGYPFCAIQTNKNTHQHSQRSYDAIVDPANKFGTFSINFYQPTATVNIDSYDEDIGIDEEEPSDYQSQKPSITNPTKPNSSPSDANKDKPSNSAAPVINCVVVLKEPPQLTTPPPTTTPAPSLTQRPSNHPSFYPQFPTILTHPPHHPRDPHFSIGPFQIIPLPYPPFLGLLGPSTSSSSGTPNWPNWPSGSQAYASNNPSSSIPPTWPYWPVASPSVASSVASQGNTNPQIAPTWPYLGIPPQPASSQVPTTSPYLPSSFWTAINPAVGNASPSPSGGISIHSNPAAWFRPPTGAFNPNHLMQQHYYNEHTGVGAADEIRSALHDKIAPENKDKHVETLIGDENVQRSQKQHSRRMGEKSKI